MHFLKKLFRNKCVQKINIKFDQNKGMREYCALPRHRRGNYAIVSIHNISLKKKYDKNSNGVPAGFIRKLAKSPMFIFLSRILLQF